MKLLAWRGSTRGRVALAAAFTAAAHRYWFRVFPVLTFETRRWQARAAAIPSPTLRELALDSQLTKRRSLDGAAAFAAFTPRKSRRALVQTLTAYQVMFDYLDTVSERPSSDPIANGRQLHQALVTAIDSGGLLVDYYAHHVSLHGGDNCYLRSLIDATRAGLSSFPSHAAIASAARRAAERTREYQSFNHGDADDSRDAFARWARTETDPDTGLRWWETGAAPGSSAPVLALIAASAHASLSPAELAALTDAYYPWAAALHTLLDSLVDRQEDIRDGQRSLLDYYSTPEEAAERLRTIATQALGQTQALPTGRSHTLLLVAMVSFYLADPRIEGPHAHPAREQVLKTMGDLATPTIFVFRAQRAATELVRTMAFIGSRSRRQRVAQTHTENIQLVQQKAAKARKPTE